MPIDRGSHISALIEEVKHLVPNSILDIGCGFGHMGSIFRAYTDIRLSELDHSRYHKWQTNIEAIEIFENYRNPQWLVYNMVHIGDAVTILDELEQYDLIYCGDVIEHLTKEDGHAFLSKMLAHGKHVIIATPSPAPAQDALLGNTHEIHLSSWDESDFQSYPHRVVGNFGGILLIDLCKEYSTS